MWWPTEVEQAPDRLALSAFAGAVVIGGSNYVAIRYSNRELDPIWGAGLRFTGAAVVFGILFAALRLSFPRGRALALIVVYGLLAFAAAYGCMYLAMQEVTAGVAAVVVSIGPLLTLLFAVAHWMEHLDARALAGSVIAFGGSALVFFQPGRRISASAPSPYWASPRSARPRRSSSRSSSAASTRWR